MRTRPRNETLEVPVQVRAHASRRRKVALVGLMIWLAAACGDSSRDSFPRDDAGAMSEAGGTGFQPAGEARPSACEAARLRRAPLGCEYVIFSVPDGSASNEGCTALFLSNPSERPSRIEIMRDGKALDVASSSRLVSMTMTTSPGYEPLDGAELPPGASAVVALVDGAGGESTATESLGKCPFPALLDESKVGYHPVGDVRAFEVRSSEPVFATYVFPYSYSLHDGVWHTGLPSSTALRSSGSWDTSNVDIGMFIPGRPVPQHEREGNPVYGDMEAFLALGSVRDAKVKVPDTTGVHEIDVPAGHVIRLRRDDQFIGSAITSDVPVATFVGARLAQLPYNFGEANPILNQAPAPTSWGNEYAAIRYPDRYAGVEDLAIYRIIGGTDGTKLSYEPFKPVGAPEAVGAGQLAMFMTSASFVIRSQDEGHGFHMTIAMTSSEYVQPEDEWKTGATGRGGPELVSLVARREFAHRFAFMTEHTYPDAHLVLVRAKDNGSFHPVTLGCAGVVEGWHPLGSGETYETTTVVLSAGKFEPQPYAGGTCHNGPHTIQSEGPFTGYVWSWANEKATGLDPPEAAGVSLGFALYGLPASVSPAGR